MEKQIKIKRHKNKKIDVLALYWELRENHKSKLKKLIAKCNIGSGPASFMSKSKCVREEMKKYDKF